MAVSSVSGVTSTHTVSVARTSSTTPSSCTTAVSSTTAVSRTTAKSSIVAVGITVEDITKLSMDTELKDAELYIEQSNDFYNWLEENVIQPIKSFIEDIGEDIRNYDADNDSEEKVFSANYFSSYNNVLVIKTPFDASVSLGVIGLSRMQEDSNTLNHEYGHTIQLDNMGIFSYTTDVAIPSITANILDRMGKLPYDYYGSEWEAEADALGNVERNDNNTPWPDEAYDSYWDLIVLFFE